MQRLRAPRQSGSRAEYETRAAPDRWEQEWATAAEIDRSDAARAAHGRARGLGLLGLMALAAGIVAGAYPLTPGFSPHDTPAVVLAAATVAAVSVAVVLAANRAGRELPRAGTDDVLVVTAALASVGAAAIHFAVAKMHFDEYTLFGVFFVVSGIAQLV